MVPIIVLAPRLIVPKLLKMPKVVILLPFKFMVASVVFVVVAPELFIYGAAFKSSVPSLVKVLPERLVIPTPERL